MLGNILNEQGKQNEALNAFNNAIKYKSDHIAALWARCFTQLPIIYPSDESSIQDFRQRYYKELTTLRQIISLKNPQEIEAAAAAVGSHRPFYLAYQGFNDRELQKDYGDMICRIMASKYPQWAERPAMPTHLPEEPIRIGVVSHFFCLHSVWKILIKGWIENLDKNRFKLYGYHAGKKKKRIKRQNSQGIVSAGLWKTKIRSRSSAGSFEMMVFTSLSIQKSAWIRLH